MDKKLTIKESFNLGKGWNLMIFAILAMLVTNAGVNDGLNIALPEIAKGAGLDYELCLSMGTVAGFVGVAMMLVIAKFRDRFGGRKVSAALFIIFGFTFYFLFLRASNIVMYGMRLVNVLWLVVDKVVFIFVQVQCNQTGFLRREALSMESVRLEPILVQQF